MADNSRPLGSLCLFDNSEGFSKSAYLIWLDKDGVGCLLGDAPFKALYICGVKVITYKLNFFA